MNKGVWFVIVLIAALVVAYLGFGEVLLAPGDTDVSVIVNDLAPTIDSFTGFPASIVPGDTLTFTFTASDENGAVDLNDSTAFADADFASEPTRSDSDGCSASAPSGNSKTYTCEIPMEFYDDDGVWTITVSIEDQGGQQATDNTQIFTLQPLKSISFSRTDISFSAVSPGVSTNVLSLTPDMVISNTGNQDIPNEAPLEITAQDLLLAGTGPENISASNFNAKPTVGVDVCDEFSGGATSLLTGNPVIISGVNILRGSASSDNFTYCLKSVPAGIPSGSYTATQAGGNPWIIALQ